MKMSRILHTADWHLKHNHPYTSMVEGKVWDQLCQAKLDTLFKLPGIMKTHSCETCLIAGDIFDTSNPPEAIKAEVCKVINKLSAVGQVVIIPGRPGDHDFVAKNNFVMMDLKEAYTANMNVIISDTNFFDMGEGILASHVMLSGISDMYKNTYDLDDKAFRGYRMVLLGDYHAYYVKKFGKTKFVYSGAPYPTRFGENNDATVNIVDTKTRKVSKIHTRSYQLLETHYGQASTVPVSEQYVTKIKAVAASGELSKTVNALQGIRKNMMSGKKQNCLDVVFSITTDAVEAIKKSATGKTIRQTCLEYIEDNADMKKSSAKLFRKLEASV